jgi:SMC interacting uncharacterized protein involved in chromosome segregation
MTEQQKRLLRRLATMNVDIVEARRGLDAVREKISALQDDVALKRLQEGLQEMLHQRASIMRQLNSLSYVTDGRLH